MTRFISLSSGKRFVLPGEASAMHWHQRRELLLPRPPGLSGSKHRKTKLYALQDCLLKSPTSFGFPGAVALRRANAVPLCCKCGHISKPLGVSPQAVASAWLFPSPGHHRLLNVSMLSEVGRQETTRQHGVAVPCSQFLHFSLPCIRTFNFRVTL